MWLNVSKIINQLEEEMDEKKKKTNKSRPRPWKNIDLPRAGYLQRLDLSTQTCFARCVCRVKRSPSAAVLASQGIWIIIRLLVLPCTARDAGSAYAGPLKSSRTKHARHRFLRVLFLILSIRTRITYHVRCDKLRARRAECTLSTHSDVWRLVLSLFTLRANRSCCHVLFSFFTNIAAVRSRDCFFLKSSGSTSVAALRRVGRIISSWARGARWIDSSIFDLVLSLNANCARPILVVKHVACRTLWTDRNITTITSGVPCRGTFGL